jgi:hypothetical protein
MRNIVLPSSDPHLLAFFAGKNDALFNRTRWFVKNLLRVLNLYGQDVFLRVRKEAETHGIDETYLWWYLLYQRRNWPSLAPRLKYALRGALAVFLLQEKNAPGKYFRDLYQPVTKLIPSRQTDLGYRDPRRPVEPFSDLRDIQVVQWKNKPPEGVPLPPNEFLLHEALQALARGADLDFRRRLTQSVEPSQREAIKEIRDLYEALYGAPITLPYGKEILLWDIQEGFFSKNRLKLPLPDRDELEHIFRWLFHLKLTRPLKPS